MEITDGTTLHGDLLFDMLFAKISISCGLRGDRTKLGEEQKEVLIVLGCQDTIMLPHGGHLENISHLQNS